MREVEMSNSTQPSRGRLIGGGLVAGTVAGVVMTTVMLLLASVLGLATPLTIFGDRISVFIQADDFLALMGRVGGYNRMKQLGVSSVMAGQIIVGALGGIIYALWAPRLSQSKRRIFSFSFFVLLPLLAVAAVLWPVLGTHYGGLPIRNATVATLLGLFVSFLAFERTLVSGFSGIIGRPRRIPAEIEYTPPIGRRTLILGGLGLLVAGGGVSTLR